MNNVVLPSDQNSAKQILVKKNQMAGHRVDSQLNGEKLSGQTAEWTDGRIDRLPNRQMKIEEIFKIYLEESEKIQ